MACPIFTYGGPSPRIRALASHDRLTRRNSAASLGVSRRSVDFASRVGLKLNGGGSAPIGARSRDPAPRCATIKFRGTNAIANDAHAPATGVPAGRGELAWRVPRAKEIALGEGLFR